jgi:hypothetical protein
MASVLRPASAVALAIALSSGVALAAQKLGVDVYPGAKALDAKSAYVKATTHVAEAYCYGTADGPDAVAAFVLKQAGFVTRERYAYRRQKVDVVIHPPAANPKTGAMSPTVFCIMTARD